MKGKSNKPKKKRRGKEFEKNNDLGKQFGSETGNPISVENQFKPGQSGNPSGLSKQMLFLKELKEQALLRDQRGKDAETQIYEIAMGRVITDEKPLDPKTRFYYLKDVADRPQNDKVFNSMIMRELNKESPNDNFPLQNKYELLDKLVKLEEENRRLKEKVDNDE